MATVRCGSRNVAAVGILGGTFNPPHNGHLELARQAAARLGLERVVLVPCGEAPHKVIVADPGRETRLEMTRVAFEMERGFSVSPVEVERPGPSYTFETLEELGSDSAGLELVLILGADAALGFERWKRPDRIVELARLGIADRAGVGEEELASALGRAGATGRTVRFEMRDVPVSSTLVRERAGRGQALDDLVPEAVAEMIAREGLYR